MKKRRTTEKRLRTGTSVHARHEQTGRVSAKLDVSRRPRYEAEETIEQHHVFSLSRSGGSRKTPPVTLPGGTTYSKRGKQ